MHQGSSEERIKRQVTIYVRVFVALAVLTVVTVAISYLHLPVLPAIVAALLIASFKASLVAGYFMHLISERQVIYALLAMTGIFLVCMAILFLGSHHDPIKGSVYYVPQAVSHPVH